MLEEDIQKLKDKLLKERYNAKNVYINYKKDKVDQKLAKYINQNNNRG